MNKRLIPLPYRYHYRRKGPVNWLGIAITIGVFILILASFIVKAMEGML